MLGYQVHSKREGMKHRSPLKLLKEHSPPVIVERKDCWHEVAWYFTQMGVVLQGVLVNALRWSSMTISAHALSARRFPVICVFNLIFVCEGWYSASYDHLGGLMRGFFCLKTFQKGSS